MVSLVGPAILMTGVSSTKQDQPALTAADYEGTKKELLEDSWRPEFFKD
jgi:hypothetical protein